MRERWRRTIFTNLGEICFSAPFQFSSQVRCGVEGAPHSCSNHCLPPLSPTDPNTGTRNRPSRCLTKRQPPPIDFYMQSMVSLRESIERRESESHIFCPPGTPSPRASVFSYRQAEGGKILGSKGEGNGSQLPHKESLRNKGLRRYWQRSPYRYVFIEAQCTPVKKHKSGDLESTKRAGAEFASHLYLCSLALAHSHSRPPTPPTPCKTTHVTTDPNW